MKDKSLIGIIIGIVIVVGIGVGEQLYLEAFSNKMVHKIYDVEKLISTGNIEESRNILQNIMKKWESDKNILGIIIDHEDIKRISLSLIEINKKLENFSYFENVSPNFAILKEYIKAIEGENKFTIVNVL